MSAEPRVRVAEECGGVLVRVVLQAPKGNVIDGAMAGELARALRGPLAARAHALLLEGEGAHFSYGASIQDHLPERIAAFLPAFHDCFRALMELSKPVLAVVRGQCLGGGLELAAFCHRVFASPDARLGQPEIRLGVFAPVGSLVLPHRLGQAAAEELLLTGRTLDAAEALRRGLVDQVDAEPGEAARRYFAESLQPLSATSLSFALRAARSALHARVREHLDRVEQLYLGALMATPDAAEGVRAFLEKRAPRFGRAGEGGQERRIPG